MSGIRVTYSGLVSLSFGLAKIIVGLFFVTIITRLLLVEEFGTWVLISGLFVYGVVLSPIFSFWATRETARKINSGKTSVLAEGLFSVAGMGIYILAVILVSPQTDVDQNVLIFAVLLIPAMYIHKILSAINVGWKPHTVPLSNFYADVTKIPLVLIFLYYLDMGVVGVIIAFFIGYVINNIALLWYGREKVKNKIKKEFIQKWLKISWLPLYPQIAPLFARSDIVIFSVITGSVVGLAYYSAALVIAGIVGFAGAFSIGVYGKLLGEERKNYLGHSITLQTYFMILFAGLAIIFAEYGLFVLNPIYQIASLVVIILTIRIFFQTLNGLFTKILTGMEDVDTKIESKFKDYVKSKLFVVPTIQLIQTISYVCLLSFVLIISNDTSTQLELVVWWVLLAVCVEIPLTIFLVKLIRKSVEINIEKIRIGKYLVVATIVFGTTFMFLDQDEISNSWFFDPDQLHGVNGLVEFLPPLLFFIILSSISYFIITWIIDSKIRDLFRAIIHEVKKTK